MSSLRQKFRLTIGAKLIGLIAILLSASIAVLVTLSTNMFVEDNKALIQQTTADTAANLATQVREQLGRLTERMRVVGTSLLQEQTPVENREQVAKEFFSHDKDFLAVLVMKDGSSEIEQRYLSEEMAALGDPDAKIVTAAVSESANFSMQQLYGGEVQIANVKLADGSMVLALGVPFMENADKTAGGAAFTRVLVAVMRPTRFTKSLADSAIITSYMVDRKGNLLAHPDAKRVAAQENVAGLEIVKRLISGKSSNEQTEYVDPKSREPKLAAFRVVGFAGLGVVAEVPREKAYEASKRVKESAVKIALVIICLGFLFGYFYSSTITWPIKRLVAASHEIAKGNFQINLKAKGHDEVASLSRSFNEMAQGLEERDRVKETFNKFHNKEIAEKLLSGEVKLGGERLEAVIFFSDVRGFTAMSESMEPEQVVEMLNEYMERMVAIIRKHNGIVDKYVGDAIMALWGVPIGDPNAAAKAVRACIDMRKELADLNALRLSRGQNELRIGMGLNIGPVIAGNIGSHEKMEYTVIGDSVNLASRMESMTKEYGTDLLVPAAIMERVQDKFLFEKSKSAKVKGKAAAIEVYKVTGYVDEAGQPVTVETAYSSYASEKSDKSANTEEPAAAPAPAEDHTGLFDRSGFMELTQSGLIRPEQLHASIETPVAEAPPIPVMELTHSVSMVPEAPIAPMAPPPIPVADLAPQPTRTSISLPGFAVTPAAQDGKSSCALFKSVPADPQQRSALRATSGERSGFIQAPPPLPQAQPPALPVAQKSVDTHWMIRIGSEAIGPMSSGELLEGFRSGELSGEWIVCPKDQPSDEQALAQWAQAQTRAA